MHRQATLLLVLFALLLLGGGVFWLLHHGDSGVAEGAGPAEAGQGGAAAPVLHAAGADSRPGAPAVPAREEMVRDEDPAIDPDYRASLCGFTGRVLTPARVPAGGRSVKLYRFDV